MRENDEREKGKEGREVRNDFEGKNKRRGRELMKENYERRKGINANG